MNEIINQVRKRKKTEEAGMTTEAKKKGREKFMWIHTSPIALNKKCKKEEETSKRILKSKKNKSSDSYVKMGREEV